MNKPNLESMLSKLKETSGSSDLILTQGTQPQLRINGFLEPLNEEVLESADLERLVKDLLTQKQFDMYQVTRSIDFSREFAGIAKFRFNIYFQRGEPAMAIRIIPSVIPGFEELGLPQIAASFSEKPHGLILITGPAGSGKSTTLAAMLDYINQNKKLHIITIEDPIEYTHHHKGCTIDQREVGSDVRSFKEALRHIFRQSPDVIMVGEMRDLETIQLVLTLAETGHLILATLHTQDTTHAISRIVDVFPVGQQQQIYFQLSQVLVGVIAQQLVITKDASRRVLATEVMAVNNAIRNLIREMKVEQIYTVIQSGRSDGMVTMNDSLREMLREDLIHEHVALHKTSKPRELQRLLNQLER
jgi:twitching motility protein PilT